MKRSTLSVIALLLLFFFSPQAFGEPGVSPELLPNIEEILEGRESYEESRWRRAEIVFFLSLPFVFLANVTAAGALHVLSDPGNSFDVKEFPPELIHFVAFSTAFTSGAIAYFDYTNYVPHHEEGEQRIKVGIMKNF